MLNDALERHRQGDYPEAERLYRELLEAEPENFELLHLLGVLKQETGHLEEALDLVEKAIDLRPDAAAFYATLASILHARGDVAGARANLEIALEKNPNLPEGHNTLGYLQLMQGELDAAEASLQTALRIEPDSERARTNMGLLLVAQGRVDEAVGQLRGVLDENPDSLAARSALGRAFLAQGAANFAEECFRRCLEQRPDSMPNRVLLGQAMLAGGASSEALEQFAGILDEEPENVAALAGAGEAALARHRPAEASQYLQRALVKRRGDPGLTAKLGDALAANREFDAAVKIYSALEGRLPEADLRARRGRALRLGGRNAEAETDLRAALELKPADVDSALLLADLLDVEARPEEARQVLEAVPDDAPRPQHVRLALAALDLAEGRSKAVLERFEGMEIGNLAVSDQAAIVEFFGRALAAAGEDEQAASYFRKLADTARKRELHWRDPAVPLSQATSWPREPVDDGREAPVLLVGLPGSGLEAVAAALAELPGVAVLDDRRTGARRDCLDDPDIRKRLGGLDETQIRLERRGYWNGVRRALPEDAEPTLVVDVLRAERFDPVQVARFFPEARILHLDRHPGEMLLHARSLGWREALGLRRGDYEQFATIMNAAGHKLGLAVERISFDRLLEDELGELEQWLEARGVATAALEEALEDQLAGNGAILRYFPPGSWKRFAGHFGWDASRLEQLAAD